MNRDISGIIYKFCDPRTQFGFLQVCKLTYCQSTDYWVEAHDYYKFAQFIHDYPGSRKPTHLIYNASSDYQTPPRYVYRHLNDVPIDEIIVYCRACGGTGIAKARNRDYTICNLESIAKVTPHLQMPIRSAISSPNRVHIIIQFAYQIYGIDISWDHADKILDLLDAVISEIRMKILDWTLS